MCHLLEVRGNPLLIEDTYLKKRSIYKFHKILNSRKDNKDDRQIYELLVFTSGFSGRLASENRKSRENSYFSNSIKRQYHELRMCELSIKNFQF